MPLVLNWLFPLPKLVTLWLKSLVNFNDGSWWEAEDKILVFLKGFNKVNAAFSRIWTWFSKINQLNFSRRFLGSACTYKSEIYSNIYERYLYTYIYRSEIHMLWITSHRIIRLHSVEIRIDEINEHKLNTSTHPQHNVHDLLGHCIFSSIVHTAVNLFDKWIKLLYFS